MNLSFKNQQNILIVDDIADNLRVLSSTLTAQGYRVRCAKNGATALKSDPQTQNIPVIFISALNELLDKVKAFEVGAVDYITKPFQVEEVLIRVVNQLELQAAKAEIHLLNQQLEQKIQERTAQLEAANQQLQQEISERQAALQKSQRVEQQLT